MPEADVKDAPPASPPPAPAAPPAPPAPPAAAAPPTPPDPAAAPPADDWRKVMAKGDEKRAKELERYTDISDVGSALFEARRALSEGGRVKPPGEKSTPEEVAAFHKAIGVPEKPDGYKITAKPPEGLELGDVDKKVLSDVVTRLHATGATNATVNAAHEFYYAAMEEAEASKIAMAEAKKQETLGVLRNTWGRDFDLNVQLADAFVSEKFGKRAAEIMQMQLMDGSRIGDNLEFMEAFAKAGRERAEDPLFIQSLNKGADPKSLEQRKTEIMAKRYGNDAERAEYARLAADGGELDQINGKLLLRK